MSQGTVCKCIESTKPLKDRNWGVSDHRCNHSAFNGYHMTPSDYSQVHCLSCGAGWRSKGQYVDSLRHVMINPETGNWCFPATP